MLKAKEAIRTLPTYHPPLAGRDGLRLDFNENVVGCSPRVLERLRQISPEDLAKYPEREPVEKKVAAFLGVRSEQVLLTNGVDEAIHLLCQTYLEPGDEALIVVPTYSMYTIYAMATGATVVRVPAAKDFRFPVHEVMKTITPRTRLIAIANPNNPTGVVVGREDLLAITAAASSAAVLIDEAYFEFYGQTMLDACGNAPNLFVARTFSKVYGLAGLRAGVLAGAAEQMVSIRRAASPYNVNAAALACLPAAIADQEYVSNYVADVKHGRSRLQAALSAKGLEHWPSEANFVLMRAGAGREQAALFSESMRRRGILVRDRSNDPGCEGCVRITLGSRDQTNRLLAALEQTIKELGLLEGASRK